MSRVVKSPQEHPQARSEVGTDGFYTAGEAIGSC